MSRLTFDPSCGLDITTTTIRELEDIATINYWGYRVVRHEGETALFVHEAYYDHREGLLGIANRPAHTCGDTMEELEENIELISQALNEPTLNYADYAVGD
ncbi:MAG: hypothetical protein AAGI91_04620 [Bacteroidota bacterium]